jgi:hypothetical protein
MTQKAFTNPSDSETPPPGCVGKGFLGSYTLQPSEEPLYLPHAVQLPDAEGTQRESHAILAFRLRYNSPNRPLCADKITAQILPPRPKNRFYFSQQAQTEGVRTMEVPLYETVPDSADASATVYYSLRIPNFSNRVLQDWIRGYFTKDEAALLNTIGFTPELLSAALQEEGGESWEIQLANYLQGLVVSECFTDERFMLRGECQDTREFMDRVNLYMIEHGITGRTLREKQEAEIQEELDRYTKEIADQEQAAKEASELELGAANSVSPLEGDKFLRNKGKMGSLYVYQEVSGTETNAAANIIMLHKESGVHKFYKIVMPYRDYERNPDSFWEKLKSLQTKYRAYSFIF